ncbi:facilitated trehalose transporter Tret1-like [Bacillus rossius redtenbacheri]|uniref:facilitated trehalose transporter Tret1-like n=1 Tax=Bacillus rossius redtenbacheri TaxID=93214 RepID=UPI002FDDAFCA
MEVASPDHEGRNGRFRQYLAVAVVNLAAMEYGAALGWTSPALPWLQAAGNPVGAGKPMTDTAASWLGSLLCLGALVSAPLLGYLCRRRSRKTAGYSVGLAGAAGWLLTALAPCEAALLAARVVLGFVASGSCIICTLYIVECVDDDIRGSMGSMINLFICAGVLFSYAAGSCVSYQTFNLLCLSLALCFLLAFWRLPETPAYLDSAGERDAADRSRRWLRLKKEAEVSEKQVPVDDRSLAAELVRSKGTRRAMAVGFGLVLNNQLSGITAVLSYTVTIFQASGSSLSPHVSAMLVGALQLSAVYLTSFLVDRAGRKALLLGSNLTTSACLAVLGLFFHLEGGGYEVSSLGWVPVVSLCVFVAAFAMGPGTLTFVLVGEIFPPHVKESAVTTCICFLNFVAFLVTRFFMGLVDALGMGGCFWFFAAFCFLSVFFCHFCVPETKNRTIESILAELDGGEKSGLEPEKPGLV